MSVLFKVTPALHHAALAVTMPYSSVHHVFRQALVAVAAGGDAKGGAPISTWTGVDSLVALLRRDIFGGFLVTSVCSAMYEKKRLLDAHSLSFGLSANTSRRFPIRFSVFFILALRRA